MKRDPALRRFFDVASTLRMTEGEASAVRTALEATMALRLTGAERAEGKEALVSFMRAHPLPEPAPSWFDALQSLLFSRAPAFALSAIIVVVGGGVAVASAAEGALPGDALYTVKVQVMEPLRERMLRTPEERVAWKVRKVERRLAEARSLMQGGSLTESHRGLLEGSIAREVRAVQEAEQGMDEETAIASQQVLEETMEHAVAAVESDAGQEQPEWRHLKTFVRAHRSAVHAEVRKRLQKVYGITEGVASPVGIVLPVSGATESSGASSAQIMQVRKQPPVAESSSLSSVASDEPALSSASRASRERKGYAKPREMLSLPLNERKVEEGEENAEREKDEHGGQNTSNAKEQETQAPDGTTVQEPEPPVLPSSLPFAQEDPGAHREQEQRNEKMMEQLKEKREDIEKQLRWFRE